MSGRTVSGGWSIPEALLSLPCGEVSGIAVVIQRQWDRCCLLGFLRGSHAGASIHLHETLGLKSFVQGFELGLDVGQ
jgi:hypothetical protein